MAIPSNTDRVSALSIALDSQQQATTNTLTTISSLDSKLQKTDFKITTLEARIAVVAELLAAPVEERDFSAVAAKLEQRLAEGKALIIENYSSLLRQRDATIERGQQCDLTAEKKRVLLDQFSAQVQRTFQRNIEDFQINLASTTSELETLQAELSQKNEEKHKKYEQILDQKEEETLDWIRFQEDRSTLSTQKAAAIEGTSANIWEAAEKGDEHYFTTFLAEHKGFDINQQNEEGHTCLTLAAAHQHESFVRLLLANRADPKIYDRNGYLPIHWAARTGNIAIAQSLLNRINPLLNQRFSYLNSRAEFGRTPLNMAVFGGHLAMVKWCLHYKADINAKTDVEGGGLTPLHLAIQRNHFPVALFLIKQPTLQLFVEDSERNTPLHDAVIARSSVIASLIIAHPNFTITRKPEHPHHPFNVIPEALAEEDPIFKYCRETFH